MSTSLNRGAKTEIREGEIVVDSKRVASVIQQHRDLYNALYSIEAMEHYHAEMEGAIDQARRALAAEPEFDHLPDFVQVDPSWADLLPVCVECGKDVPWADALLMPCSRVSDGDVDSLGIVHRRGCPS